MLDLFLFYTLTKDYYSDCVTTTTAPKFMYEIVRRLIIGASAGTMMTVGALEYTQFSKIWKKRREIQNQIDEVSNAIQDDEQRFKEKDKVLEHEIEDATLRLQSIESLWTERLRRFDRSLSDTMYLRQNFSTILNSMDQLAARYKQTLPAIQRIQEQNFTDSRVHLLFTLVRNLKKRCNVVGSKEWTLKDSPGLESTSEHAERKASNSPRDGKYLQVDERSQSQSAESLEKARKYLVLLSTLFSGEPLIQEVCGALLLNTSEKDSSPCLSPVFLESHTARSISMNSLQSFADGMHLALLDLKTSV